MANATVPAFHFSGLYYAEILQDLLAWRRAAIPELNDEDPNEPTVKLLRAFALVTHYANVLLDHVALETLITTAQLRESMRGHLRLIGYFLRQPSPATVDMLLQLAAPLTAAYTMPTDPLLFAVPATVGVSEIPFEVLDADDVPRTDQWTAVFEYDDGGGVFSDRTTEANAGIPWAFGGGGIPAVNDCLYFGHTRAIPNQINLGYTVKGTWWDDADNWVAEYYEATTEQANPEAVTDLGATLKLTLDTLLGTDNRAGASVRVRCLLTGSAETLTSTWDGTQNCVTTTALLGQTVPSTTTTDYAVGVRWRPVPSAAIVDQSTEMVLTWVLPEDTGHEWAPATVNGVEAYWVRMRCVTVPASGPTLGRVRLDRGNQWIKDVATQGRSVSDTPAASGTGLANQTVTTSRPAVIGDSVVVTVDDGAGAVAWSAVETFLNAAPTDLAYTVEHDDEGYATVTFGDGVSGKAPSIGVDNIALTYRVNADQDGNVAPGAVAQNNSALSIVLSVINPRGGAGWQAADGADAADLDRLRVEGPASLRTLDRALTGEDVETLAVAYRTAENAKLVYRCFADEDYYGPRTARLVVVGPAGDLLDAAYLEEIEDYFNGVPAADEPGVAVLGAQVTPENYVPHPVAITATVTGGSQAAVEAALRAYLTPLATTDTGRYAHAFGNAAGSAKVYRSKLANVIFEADSDVTNVVLTVPATDVTLGDGELPTCGALTIVMV